LIPKHVCAAFQVEVVSAASSPVIAICTPPHWRQYLSIHIDRLKAQLGLEINMYGLAMCGARFVFDAEEYINIFVTEFPQLTDVMPLVEQCFAKCLIADTCILRCTPVI
jgi:hypothetical protein